MLELKPKLKLKEKIINRRLDKQFKETTEGGYSGAGLQSSECPWLEAILKGGGPEPTCVDLDWEDKLYLEEAEYTYLRGGLCPTCRGFGHDERGIFVKCAG